MVSRDNLAYFQIEPHSCHEPTTPTQTPTTASSTVPDYEVVPPQPKQRVLDIPVYEVPPPPIAQYPQTRAQHPQTNVPQPEGDYGLIGAVFNKPTKPVRNTKEVTGSPPTAISPSVYEVPPPFKSREETHGGSPQASRACPLDVSQNELEKLGYAAGTSQLGPDAAALAMQPGYEFMGRNSPVDAANGQYEYEVLTPPQGGFEMKGAQTPGSQYELLTMPKTQSTGASQAQSPPVYEIAPPPILAPQGPRAAPPIPSQGPPVYEIAPTPRPLVPVRPPPYNVPLIENMDDKAPVPPLAPRPYNEYQRCPVQPLVEPIKGPTQQGVPPPYEQVRIEAPKGKLNLDQVPPPAVPSRTYMGEYCSLDPKATEPTTPPPVTQRGDVSSGSSFGSGSGSDASEIPGIPPPSPSVAEAAVCAALNTQGESVPKGHPLARGRPPVPSPRQESLNDRPKWYTEDEDTKHPGHNVVQDPFDKPPAKEEEDEVTPVSYRNEDSTIFTSLHSKFSPHGSRENLTEELPEENAKEETIEDRKEVVQTPLLYENVLFKRSDSVGTKTHEKGTTSERKDISEENKTETRLSSDMSSLLDEEAEWAKIDQLLMSFGEIENIEQIADAGQATTVPEWLKAFGVVQYESELMNNVLMT